MGARLPVHFVTGFLGSGKTTLLRQAALRNPDRRFLFIVNELSATDVDGPRLEAIGLPTASVLGGSLFCECRAGEFVQVLRSRVPEAHAKAPVDAIIVETSGMADPGGMGLLFADHGLSDTYDVRGVTVVAAASRLPTLLANLPVARAQVEAADLVLLNKADLATAGDLAEAEAAIRAVNPAARIRQTRYCETNFPPPGSNAPRLPGGALATCEANPFSDTVLDAGHPLSHDTFEHWVRNLPETIYRLKGQVLTNRGTFRVERTIDGTTLEPSSPMDRTSLVVLALDEDESILNQCRQSFRELAATPPKR